MKLQKPLEKQAAIKSCLTVLTPFRFTLKQPRRISKCSAGYFGECNNAHQAAAAQHVPCGMQAAGQQSLRPFWDAIALLCLCATCEHTHKFAVFGAEFHCCDGRGYAALNQGLQIWRWNAAQQTASCKYTASQPCCSFPRLCVSENPTAATPCFTSCPEAHSMCRCRLYSEHVIRDRAHADGCCCARCVRLCAACSTCRHRQ